MEDEEEDRLLFSRLGVTSANPEDIEHVLLKKVEDGGVQSCDEVDPAREDVSNTSSSKRILLCNKLRALNVEINAVASTIEQTKTVVEIENDDPGTNAQQDAEHQEYSIKNSEERCSVQKAIATERLKSLEKTKAHLQNEIAELDKDVSPSKDKNNILIEQLVKEVSKKKQTLKASDSSLKARRKKVVAYHEDNDFDAILDASATGFVETEKDELIKKGILTPFHKLKGFERRVQLTQPAVKPSVLSRDNDTEDYASSSIANVARSIANIAKARPATKLMDAKALPALDGPTRPFQRLKTPLKRPASPDSVSEKKKKNQKRLRRPLPDRKWTKRINEEDHLSKGTDENKRENSDAIDSDSENSSNAEQSEGRSSCVILEGGLKIPDEIFSNLFDYQKVGVQWLWELHCQRAGGIIGDEMGLGKTIQVLSFLASLHFSGMYKPSIVVCPVTLLRQWQREAHKWYPQFHVEILHDSAHTFNEHAHAKSSGSDYDSEDISLDNEDDAGSAKLNKKWDGLIDHVLKSDSGMLLTTYEQLRLRGEKLLDVEWGYAVLDEGHRIRNPNAEITLVCKQLQTVHRIIMTGAPIQNKLSELWSLFDFIFPGKLGVLPVFETEFAVPITVGGYANATPLQVSTAYRCAVVLRDLVMPYLLRRMKADVNIQLPKKTEHVLFCGLTPEQRSVYCAFLASSEVEQIFDGSRNSLYGIDVLRKICNHPDLLEREHSEKHPDYGNHERSGKLKVVAQVLGVWKQQGHRVLIFTQTQQMLDILEKYMTANGYVYRRMDGLTPVKQRMALIDEFNGTSEIFAFILTTKVGGLGTNLTGANRVIIYDPDWNPSTDMQARERAWRIGQTKNVTIYRLITRGTIEEKVYHRQIYKHFLTNKILKNPQQKRFFKARDMRDLFTLEEGRQDCSTETSNIFAQLSGEVSIEVGNSNQNMANQEVATVDFEATRTENLSVEIKGKQPSDQNGHIDEGTDVLKSLLDANGIHSALNHDAIMNANDDDRIRMEVQASLVAQKAAEALRQSRMLRSKESFAIPTWTGKSGAAGAPSSVRRKFGSTLNTNLAGSLKSSSEASSSRTFRAGASAGKALSSAELIARAREKQERALNLSTSAFTSSNASDARNKKPNRSMIMQPEIMIRQLCTFIQQGGGSADSSSIVLHFKERIPAKDMPLFRSLLKEIAVLEKAVGGSRWVLKPEYTD